MTKFSMRVLSTTYSAAFQAFSVALSMKERIDSMGRPANPPEVRVGREDLKSEKKKNGAFVPVRPGCVLAANTVADIYIGQSKHGG